MLFVFYENTFSCVHERNQTSNEFHGFRQCRHPFSYYHSRYDLQTTIISCMPKNGKFLENLLCHVMNRRQGQSKCFLLLTELLKYLVFKFAFVCMWEENLPVLSWLCIYQGVEVKLNHDSWKHKKCLCPPLLPNWVRVLLYLLTTRSKIRPDRCQNK